MPERKETKSDVPLLEWVVGGVGAAIFVGILAILISNAMSGAERAPSIRTQVTGIEPVAQGYVVRFTAVNDGDVTAAQVRLEATLETGAGASESREMTFDYLPPHSERRGGFLFVADPRTGRLSIEADGYADP